MPVVKAAELMSGDSQTVLKALKVHSVKSRLVNECKNAIDVLSDKNNVRLY